MHKRNMHKVGGSTIPAAPPPRPKSCAPAAGRLSRLSRLKAAGSTFDTRISTLLRADRGSDPSGNGAPTVYKAADHYCNSHRDNHCNRNSYCYSDCDNHCNSDSYCYCHAHGHSCSHGHGNAYTHTDLYSKTYTYAKI